jgi:hypothetical protein
MGFVLLFALFGSVGLLVAVPVGRIIFGLLTKCLADRDAFLADCLRQLRDRLEGYRFSQIDDDEVAWLGERADIRAGACRFNVDGGDGPVRQVRALWLMVGSSGAMKQRVPSLRYKNELGSPQAMLGDPDVDDVAHFMGDPGLLLAAMSAQRRRAVLRLARVLRARADLRDLASGEDLANRHGLLVQCTMAGTLIYAELLTPTPDADVVEKVMRGLLDLVREIDGDDTPAAQALLANVRLDPCVQVRLRSLNLLQQRFADPAQEGHHHFVAAAGAALVDADPGVRFTATGLTTGAQARTVLEGLVRDPEVNSELRRQALRKCLGPASAVRSEALRADVHLLDAALRASALRDMAGEYVKRGADQDLLRELWDRSTHEDDAWCLGLVGTLKGEPLPTNVESCLIALLDRPSFKLGVRAAHWLGEIGTAEAIEPLLAHSGEAEYDEVARAAVREIRTRLGPVEAGRLSLAASAESAGALSMASDRGALSKAGDS